jgi:ABC-type multidrug transport system fused ATPase/permease subunit
MCVCVCVCVCFGGEGGYVWTTRLIVLSLFVLISERWCLSPVQVYIGQMPAATLIAFMLYQGQLQSNCSNLFDSFTNLIKATGAGEKVFQLLDRRPRKLTRDPPVRPLVCEGNIAVNNVEFAYPTRPQAPVLRGVSFNARAGQVVALVGASGSGKSTLFHLLENFYQPNVGAVLLDGVPVHEIDHSYLHRVVRECVLLNAGEVCVVHGV